VEEVVPAAELDGAVERLVGAIVKADARAIRLQRELIRSWEAMPVNDAIQEGIRCFTRACEGGEWHRHIDAVIEGLKAARST